MYHASRVRKGDERRELVEKVEVKSRTVQRHGWGGVEGWQKSSLDLTNCMPKFRLGP